MRTSTGAGRVTTRLKVSIAAGLVAGLALTGCSAGTTASTSGGETAVRAPQGGVGASVAPSTKNGGGAMALPAALVDRSIISKASLTVRVKDVQSAARDAATRAAGAGGIIAGEETKVDPDHPENGSAVVTLRVPADHLDKVLGQLAGLGQLITQEQSSEDVTTQVVDVAARLKSQQASVDRVRLLLARARTIGEIVAIESELSQREAAVESLAAQSKTLADQTSLATVTASFYGTGADVAPPEPTTGFVAGLKSGWSAFSDSAGWLLTALGALLPFAAVALLAAGALRLVLRRRQPVVEA